MSRRPGYGVILWVDDQGISSEVARSLAFFIISCGAREQGCLVIDQLISRRLNMVGPQFTDEQRNLVFTKNTSLNGAHRSYQVLCANFQQRFLGVNPPTNRTVRNICKKQNTHFTVKNLNSKASPGPTYSCWGWQSGSLFRAEGYKWGNQAL